MAQDQWDELGDHGMATVVRRLEERLRDMLGADARLPRVLMSDRGTGMCAPSGHVTAAYDRAVRDCGFKLFWEPDAKTQSPDMPDHLLHETAVSWLRGVRASLRFRVVLFDSGRYHRYPPPIVCPSGRTNRGL